MKIRVECLGKVREIVGAEEVFLTPQRHAPKVADLLDELVSCHAPLATIRPRLSILSGLDYVDESHLLSADETISLVVE